MVRVDGQPRTLRGIESNLLAHHLRVLDGVGLIAAGVFVAKSTVSRLVDDLCADGLALRAKHPVDGRSVLLADTRSGARLAIVLARAALAVTACGNAAGHRQAEDAERGAEVRPFDLEA